MQMRQRKGALSVNFVSLSILEHAMYILWTLVFMSAHVESNFFRTSLWRRLNAAILDAMKDTKQSCLVTRAYVCAYTHTQVMIYQMLSLLG